MSQRDRIPCSSRRGTPDRDLAFVGTNPRDEPHKIQVLKVSSRTRPDLRGLKRSLINQWLNHRIAGTVIAKTSVERRSIEAAFDSTALYRAAKSTPSGLIPHNNLLTGQRVFRVPSSGLALVAYAFSCHMLQKSVHTRLKCVFTFPIREGGTDTV